jgi:hypothetical protein
VTGDPAQLKALGALLDELWNPAGVRSGGADGTRPTRVGARFAPAVLAALDRGATRAELAWQLRELAHKELNLAPTGRENEVAAMLQRWHILWTD